MSDTATELVPPPDQQAPPPEAPPPDQQAAPPEQATVERDLDADTLEIPDASAEGGKAKYVPATALVGARKELKELKDELAEARTGSAKAAELQQQIAVLQGQIQQLVPYAKAYMAAQQQAPQQTQEPPEEVAALERTARLFDFYRADGALDLDKARAHRQMLREEAERIAQQTVAPVYRTQVERDSARLLARAKNTTLPNGAKADPTILENVWRQLDPRLTATDAGAKQALAVAIGYTTMLAQQQAQAPAQRQRGPNGQFAAQQEPLSEPLLSERAGGRDTPSLVPLDDKEKAAAKALGMSEKEYLESARNAPWLRQR